MVKRTYINDAPVESTDKLLLYQETKKHFKPWPRRTDIKLDVGLSRRQVVVV